MQVNQTTVNRTQVKLNARLVFFRITTDPPVLKISLLSQSFLFRGTRIKPIRIRPFRLVHLLTRSNDFHNSAVYNLGHFFQIARANLKPQEERGIKSRNINRAALCWSFFHPTEFGLINVCVSCLQPKTAECKFMKSHP